jgi:hypothetical protein
MISDEYALELLRQGNALARPLSQAPPEPFEEDATAARIWRAIMLAPSLEVCRALLRGETVPLERLDPEWVKRFGRRRP